MKNLILFIAVSVFNFAHASSTPGQVLLDNFGAVCPSTGNWTGLALSDARSLMNTLEQLKNDPDCQTVSGAISKLGNLESKLALLNSNYSNQIEIAKLEAQEIELLSQISGQTDAGIISGLETSLRAIQLDKAGLVAMDSAYADYNGTEVKNIFNQILISTNSAYSAIAANQLCLDKNPNLLASAASLSGSVAAAAGSINPAFGYGIATVTDFIGNTVNYFRDRGYNRSIRNIANGSTVIQGFQCALEAMTNRWCDVQEAHKFLTFESSYDPTGDENDELAIISNLYDKDIPVFLNWLEKVKAGAPASNSADAGRRETVYYREASLRAFRSKGEGWFSENKKLYDLASNNREKYNVIRTVINNVRQNLDGRGPNPLVDIHPASYAPYYLLGLSKIPTTQSGNAIDFNNFDPFTQWPNGTYTPDFQLMITLYNAWINQAQRRVTQELNQVLQPDPLQILSIYGERTSNVWKQSPAQALQNILVFIEENKPEKRNETSFNELYETTIQKLIKINDAVLGNFVFDASGCGDVDPEEPEEPVPSDEIDITDILENADNSLPKTCDKLRQALEIIFEEAQLEFGPIVFKNRLETIIRVAIDEYIQTTNPEEQGHIAQLLAADSYLDVLALVSGTDDKALIMADIENAKGITLSNMSNFASTFGSYINTLLFNNHSYVTHPDPVISSSYRKRRAKMCFLLASLPEWPSAIKKKYCLGMQLESLFPGGPSSEVLTEDLLNRPFSKRSCLYREYLEHSKIYQDWGIILEGKR